MRTEKPHRWRKRGDKKKPGIHSQLKRLLGKGIMVEGVVALKSSTQLYQEDLHDAEMFSKMPMSRVLFGTKEYGLAVTHQLSKRTLLSFEELKEGIYLLEFDGYNRHYWAIGLAPVLDENYMMPCLKWSDTIVAVSDREPVEEKEYECTLIEKLAEGGTAANRKTMKISKVTYYGQNTALCELERGERLLVTWNEQ